MKTIVDVIAESMNDEYAELKRCKNVGEFVCTLVGISDLSDFDEELYDDIDTTDNSIPFDQGDFKSTRKWIIANEDEPISDIKVMHDKYSKSLSPSGVIQLKLKNKVYKFAL